MANDAASTASGGSVVSAMTKATSMAPPSTVKVEGGSKGGGNTTSSLPQRNKGTVASVAVMKRGFEGREAKLAGFIYSYGSDSADKYIKTTEEVLQFAGTTYTHGDEMAFSYTEDIEEPRKFDRPGRIVTDPSEKGYNVVEYGIWKEKIKAVAKKESRYEEECKQFYNVIWGQCTTTIQEKVRSLEIYKTLKVTKSPIGLLKAIKSVMFNVEDEVNRVHTLVINDRKLYSLTREAHWSVPQYYKRFKTHIEVIENTGGTIVAHPALVEEELSLMENEDGDPIGKNYEQASREQRDLAQELAHDRYLGALFVLGLGNGYKWCKRCIDEHLLCGIRLVRITKIASR